MASPGYYSHHFQPKKLCLEALLTPLVIPFVTSTQYLLRMPLAGPGQKMGRFNRDFQYFVKLTSIRAQYKSPCCDTTNQGYPLGVRVLQKMALESCWGGNGKKTFINRLKPFINGIF
jgi:hypothetical protein